MKAPHFLVGLVAAFAFVAAAAAAPLLEIGPLGSETTIDPGNGGTTLFVDNGDGTFDWEGAMTMPMWETTWDLLIDEDPGVSGVIGLKNTTGTTQTFTFNVSTGVSVSLPAGSTKSGSSTISVGDANFNSTATLSAVTGGAMYNALVDGNLEHQLFQDPYSLVVSTFGGTTGATQSFTGVTTNALAVSLGINHVFQLTAGDQATFNSTFEVIPLPSSAGVGFGVLALMGVVRAARHRRNAA